MRQMYNIKSQNNESHMQARVDYQKQSELDSSSPVQICKLLAATDQEDKSIKNSSTESNQYRSVRYPYTETFLLKTGRCNDLPKDIGELIISFLEKEEIENDAPDYKYTKLGCVPVKANMKCVSNCFSTGGNLAAALGGFIGCAVIPVTLTISGLLSCTGLFADGVRKLKHKIEIDNDNYVTLEWKGEVKKVLSAPIPVYK